MREIKFRGLTENTRKMVYGSLVCYPSGHYSIEDHSRGVDNIVHVYNVVPETIGQFTGLRDKDGTEIFEGDIITAKSKYGSFGPARVYWDKSNVNYSVSAPDNGILSEFYADDDGPTEDEDWQSLAEFYDDGGSDIYVIGNIHESPELLK